MTVIGYHASHEQFTPSELLDFVRLAEQAGFSAVMSSDHFAPWSPAQGEAGFAWSWLGAALQATTRLTFGSIAVPVGFRYHPAIIAQATATLADMFPGRFQWIAAGSGQALNEQGLSGVWPEKEVRNQRLLEGVRIMRELWRGATITRETGPIPLSDAKLWTRPPHPLQIWGAALTPPTARWVGGWADGLMTISQPADKLRELIAAFRNGGGEGKPLFLQVHLSWAPTDAEALENAYEQWRSNAIDADLAENLQTPEQFVSATQTVRREDMNKYVLISSSLQQHAEWIGAYAELGFEHIFLHNVGRNQPRFIQSFGEYVLPVIATRRARE